MLQLRNVAMTIHHGERIALVGETGHGKSTLLKLIRNLYHPQSIKLAVDSKPIPEGFAGIARASALVPQTPEIFATTIYENVAAWGDYSIEYVRQFTDIACITKQSMPCQTGSIHL